MKKRKQFLKKIGAVLCSMFVLFACIMTSNIYYASESLGQDYVESCPYGALSGRYLEWCSVRNETAKHGDSFYRDASYSLPKDIISTYDYFIVMYYPDNSQYCLIVSNAPFEINSYSEGTLGHLTDSDLKLDYDVVAYSYYSYDGINWGSPSSFERMNITERDSVTATIHWTWLFCDSNYWVINGNSSGVYMYSNGCAYYWAPTLNFDGSPFGSEPFNSNLGYIQNVSRKSTYIRDELYNYDDDSLTYHWYHDLTSTGGADLSSGIYKIRHYISNAKVKGYDKADIVEMSEKYLMNEYDASKGYFSYLQKDYLEKLEELGYEEIGFIDKYLKGYFTLQHHYFQIVNTSTNEVGGYLHFYPKDASGENFGVEMVYEGLDLNDEIDPDAPNGFIDTDVGSGTTIEDALENADAPKLDDLGGIDPLIENLEGYASQITNVTNGIGALLGSLPPWIVGLLGLSFGLFFVLIAVKALRG